MRPCVYNPHAICLYNQHQTHQATRGLVTAEIRGVLEYLELGEIIHRFFAHLRGGILTNKTIPRSPSGSKRVFPSVPGSWHNQLHHPDRPGREHRNMRLFGRQICFSSFLVARMEHPYIWWVDISMVVDVPWWAKFDHQALCQKKVLQYLMLDNVWRSFLIPQTSANMFFWRIPKFTS